MSSLGLSYKKGTKLCFGALEKKGVIYPTYNTYIFKSVFAELNHEVEKDQGREPQTPHHHLLHCLHVQYAKDENELVEDEVPELIFQVLRNKHRAN